LQQNLTTTHKAMALLHAMSFAITTIPHDMKPVTEVVQTTAQ